MLNFHLNTWAFRLATKRRIHCSPFSVFYFIWIFHNWAANRSIRKCLDLWLRNLNLRILAQRDMKKSEIRLERSGATRLSPKQTSEWKKLVKLIRISPIFFHFRRNILSSLELFTDLGRIRTSHQFNFPVL